MNRRKMARLTKLADKLDLDIKNIKGTPQEVSRYLNKMAKLAKLKAKKPRFKKTWSTGSCDLKPRFKSDGGDKVKVPEFRVIIHECPENYEETFLTQYMETHGYSEKKAIEIARNGWTRFAQGFKHPMDNIKAELEEFGVTCVIKRIPKRS